MDENIQSILDSFGRAVQAARENKRWSRDHLAELLSCTPRYLQYIETKGRHPSIELFLKIAMLMGLSVDSMIYPETTTQKSTQRRQLDEMLDGLTERDMVIVDSLVKTLHDSKP